MTHPNFVILFVDRPQDSAVFYKKILGVDPLEVSPTFAMFALDSGIMLGLWSKHTADPAPATTGGGCELAISLESDQRVDEHFARWSAAGVTILQAPVQLDFGYTCLASDLDGHRIRAFCPAEH